MKIALIARRFDPDGGGTERDLMITAEHLRAAGHQIAIYADELRGVSPDWRVRRVPALRAGRAARLWSFAHLAAPAARREGAEMVLSFARIVGADVLRSGGSAHSSYLRAAHRWRGAARALAMRLSPYHLAQVRIECAGFRAPELRLAIAVSNLVRGDLAREFELPAERLVTLYNGVDLTRFRPVTDAAERRRIRASIGIDGPVPAVLFAGNGFARKGLGFLIDAWPSIRGGAHLMVAGADRSLTSYRRRARRLGVAERIHFLGARSDLAQWFKAADAMALPSLFEPFGNVVLEAMAAGLAALTSVQSGVAEVMPERMRPFIVERPDDPSEIARRLEGLLGEQRELGALARAAAERFTWERYGRELCALVESAARSTLAGRAR